MHDYLQAKSKLSLNDRATIVEEVSKAIYWVENVAETGADATEEEFTSRYQKQNGKCKPMIAKLAI